MALSAGDEQLLLNAFLASVESVGTVEQKLVILFRHALRSEAERSTERRRWLDGLAQGHTDSLDKLDANVAEQKTQLANALKAIRDLQDTVALGGKAEALPAGIHAEIAFPT